jgi:hypothetical protein
MSVSFSTAGAAARRISSRGRREAAWPIAGATLAPAALPSREPPVRDAGAPPPEEAPGGAAVPPPPEEPLVAETAPPSPEEPSVAEAAAPPAEEPLTVEAATSPPAPETAAPAPEKPPATEAAASPKPSQKMELIIDSLQNFELGKPIPVLVERLAEKKFKATVPDSDISSAGVTMGEAFLQLKDQIERSYGKYHNQKNLEPEQQRQLEFLQKYVLREKRRSGWGFR